MTLKLQMSDHSAAKIIQKEVRKFLLSLGFYEARQTLMSSPERSQVNIYMKNLGSKRSTSRKSKLSSSQRRSPDYELVDLKSSKKSSIKLHISPQQLRNLIEIEK
jgi:GTP cyclohydrolase I